jgi:hypothetical protein
MTRTGLIIAALLLSGGSAFAEVDHLSANYIMPRCRELIYGKGSNPAFDYHPDYYLQGYCAGTLFALSDSGQAEGVICRPTVSAQANGPRGCSVH